ncbi:MAG: hypothetical protein WBD99_05680 [Thermodesulfobacteriota bacterium]
MALVKLKALQSALAERLKDPRGRYFDPSIVLEYFDRYAPIRDALRSQFPDVVDDLPVRTIPTPSNTTDFSGRGYIERHELEVLNEDMQYILAVMASSPAVYPPSMKVTRQGVFFSGQYFDALREVADIVGSAKMSIALIDGYIAAETLDVLAGKAGGVNVQILTKNVSSQVKALAEAFQKQHGHLEIRSSHAFHDRFLIIDDSEFYHFGASIKDLGKRGFMFSVIEEPEVTTEIRSKFQQEWSAARIIAKSKSD